MEVLVVIAIIIVIVFSFIYESFNLGKHECCICKKVKKGVRKRDVFLQPLHGPVRKLGFRNYYCDECANGKSYFIVRETYDDDLFITSREEAFEKYYDDGMFPDEFDNYKKWRVDINVW